VAQAVANSISSKPAAIISLVFSCLCRRRQYLTVKRAILSFFYDQKLKGAGE
jgi:hypothetical protein